MGLPIEKMSDANLVEDAIDGALDDEILEGLCAVSTRQSVIGDDVRAAIRIRDVQIYTDAIWSLIHVRYDADQARKYWDEILEHRTDLKTFLGRDVGLRVSAIDYFVNIARELGSPRVVHPHLLEQLRNEATRDPLTGLNNRRVYREQLDVELSRAGRHGSEFVVAIFDLDNFKRINDTQGHAAGDRILRETARIILASIRKTDLATRWGGEEFVVLMPETNKDGGFEVAQRIRRSVEADLGAHGVTVSGGLAGFPHDGGDESSLFAFADRSLYRAKSEGKNRICAQPQERRKFSRLGGTFTVRISGSGDENGNLAITSNVGAGGLSYTTSSPPRISSLVSGSILVSGELVAFTGRAVYVEEADAGWYEVGIHFVEITDEGRRAITHVLQREPAEVR